MKNTFPRFNEKYFGSFSRDGLRAVKFMADKWPKQKTFTNEDIGKEIKLKGTSLGGVLGSFSRREEQPVIMKVGMVSISLQGEKFTRSKQLWALNPKLTKEHIKQIKQSLNNFLLE